MIIRNAARADIPALADIINHYIVDGHITLDTEPTTVEERERWFASYGTGPHQLLVAAEQARILGCAYSSRYRSHPAFDATVETSIYLAPAARGRGTGTRLYENLLARLQAQRLHVAVAGVALPNEGSLALHRKVGFEQIGTFGEYAIKNGVFISSAWFERVFEPA